MFKLSAVLGWWIVLAVMTAITGLVGRYWLEALLGQYNTHLVKVAVGVLVALLASWGLAKSIQGKLWLAASLASGALWLGLSILTEFALGKMIFDIPLEQLASDYEVWNGRYWPVVLLAQLVGPFLMGMKRNN